jgi:hypothetical protein
MELIRRGGGLGIKPRSRRLIMGLKWAEVGAYFYLSPEQYRKLKQLTGHHDSSNERIAFGDTVIEIAEQFRSISSFYRR